MKRTQSAALALTALAITASSASAAVVSWNLNHWSDSPTNASATAGVVATSYWNDTWLDGLPNPANNLRDSTGATTTVDVSWVSFNTWSIVGTHVGADADGTLNREMLNGYLSAGPAGWGPNPTYSQVSISGITYASYDIIVYFSSDVAGREGDVTDGATTYSFNTVGPASISGANALFAQTTDTLGSYATTANYAVFSNLSGASQTITVQMRDNDEWGGIAGFQIVQVPEPTAALLGGLGLLGLLGLLRRRRA